VDHYQRGPLRFPVRDTGPPDGQAVVLLHGFPQDHSSYDKVLPHLHARGLRTLVPLQRGYAATARPEHRRNYRMSELAADVIALLDAAEIDRAHLVGHDWGGAVGWALAAHHSDRIQSLTVLSTPHPTAFITALWRSSQALMSGYMAFFQTPWLPEAVLRRSLRNGLIRSGLPAADAHRYCQRMLDGGALTGALNWYRALPLSRNRTVEQITVPTTYVWGRHDFALGRAAAQRTQRYVTADYRFLEIDAGHWLPERHPSEVAGAILRRVLAL